MRTKNIPWDKVFMGVDWECEGKGKGPGETAKMLFGTVGSVSS